MREADIRAAFKRAPNNTVMRGDYDLNPLLSDERPARSSLKPAAVLVPIMLRNNGFTVLFTKRTATLKHHADQVSFPGGKVEAADANATATALREACEEIGLPQGHVEVIGALDEYETRTGFHIVPIVGFINPDFDCVMDSDEVAAVFEVPLTFLLDPANHTQRTDTFKGRTGVFYELPYAGHRIWGATAGIVVNLAERLNRNIVS